MTEVTEQLLEWSAGDAEARDRLIELVYDDLRRLASSFFAGESPGNTLQPTALVNELYLRLVDQRRARWKNRAQFFAVTARLMRRILVDRARRRRAAKRQPVTLTMSGEAWDAALSHTVDVLWLHEALEKLAEFAPRQAWILELRFFAGMTIEEVAHVLEVSPSTVKNDWRIARAWLLRELGVDG